LPVFPCVFFNRPPTNSGAMCRFHFYFTGAHNNNNNNNSLFICRVRGWAVGSLSRTCLLFLLLLLCRVKKQSRKGDKAGRTDEVIFIESLISLPLFSLSSLLKSPWLNFKA
jgi:hypothetical protein